MNFVINIDKPKGLTSQDVVTKVKRALKIKKAGHAGTLDPMATGVLVVCTGEATKISSLMMDLQKEYLATVRFGSRTDTYDAEGEVVETNDKVLAEDDIAGALAPFRGTIMQTPPVYSALKKDGQPLYKLARKGEKVEVKPREVTVYSIEMTAFEWPDVTLLISCSKGTYIRSIADDLGRALGTVAHLAALRRTRVGGFNEENMVALDGVAESREGFLSVDDALSHIKEVVLSPEDYKRASHGGAVEKLPSDGLEEGETVKLKSPSGVLFAIAAVAGNRIKIARILHLTP